MFAVFSEKKNNGRFFFGGVFAFLGTNQRKFVFVLGGRPKDCLCFGDKPGENLGGSQQEWTLLPGAALCRLLKGGPRLTSKPPYTVVVRLWTHIYPNWFFRAGNAQWVGGVQVGVAQN